MDISFEELKDLTNDFFKSVAEDQQATLIVKKLNTKLDTETETGPILIGFEDLCLNVPAEISEAAAHLGANVSSNSETQKDIVAKVEQMKSELECETLSVKTDQSTRELGTDWKP